MLQECSSLLFSYFFCPCLKGSEVEMPLLPNSDPPLFLTLRSPSSLFRIPLSSRSCSFLFGTLILFPAQNVFFKTPLVTFFKFRDPIFWASSYQDCPRPPIPKAFECNDPFYDRIIPVFPFLPSSFPAISFCFFKTQRDCSANPSHISPR